MQVNLTDKVALVTGSSKGIGKAVALTLARNGADIVLTGRNQDQALPVLEEISGMGRQACFEQADIWDYQEVRRMVDRAVQRFGKVDILVASGAGGGAPPGFFKRIAPELYLDVAKGHWLFRLFCV